MRIKCFNEESISYQCLLKTGKKISQDQAGSTSGTNQSSSSSKRSPFNDLKDAKENFTKTEEEIKQLKREISEKCDRLQQLSAQGAEIWCARKRNLEVIASSITFDSKL